MDEWITEFVAACKERLEFANKISESDRASAPADRNACLRGNTCAYFVLNLASSFCEAAQKYGVLSPEEAARFKELAGSN